jgi:hypothetical protein
MRTFVERTLASSTVNLAALLSGTAFGQANSPAAPAEETEQITVLGEKSLGEYRLELERARDDIFRRFNEANKNNATDITCRNEQPTGSRMRQDVCRSAAEDQTSAASARSYLNSLLNSAGLYITNSMVVPNGGDTQVLANIGTQEAQNAGKIGEADALATFEQEWRRILSEDREFYQAVVKYVDLENAYNRARGVATPITDEQIRVALDAPAKPTGPQCEATTLTEYFQRNNVARVSGTVSIANCTAGTSGNFTLVARVRDESGEIKPVEFAESWQRADAQDHTFTTDYPIGDNVELVNVRVRGLTCTCADSAQ